MELSMGKSSINGPFSMAMLNNQRVQTPMAVLSQISKRLEAEVFPCLSSGSLYSQMHATSILSCYGGEPPKGMLEK